MSLLSQTDELLIGGNWRRVSDKLPVENPSTGEVIGLDYDYALAFAPATVV